MVPCNFRLILIFAIAYKLHMQNPLANYLKSAKVSQHKFAALGPWRQATVSGWCNGVIPQINDARKIAEASNGGVTVNDWVQWSRHLEESDARTLAQAGKVNKPAACGEQATNEAQA